MFKRRKVDESSLPRRRQGPDAVRSTTARETGSRTNPFARNITITGSSSHRISSSNEMGGTILSPRAHIHHLSRRRRRLLWRFAAVLTVTLALYLFVSQLVASVSIATPGVTQPLRDTATYSNTIDSYYAKHPLSRFYPLLSKDNLLMYMRDEHPEIKTIDLQLGGQLGVAQASIELRQPVARWVLDHKTMYVDEEGVVFGVNGYDVPSVTIVDENQVALDKLDKSVIASNRFLTFVGRTVGGFQTQKLTVTKATIPELTTRQLAVTIEGVPYPVKMVIDRSAGKQVEDASRIITHLQTVGETPEYIDVRISGKAYYK